MLAQRAKSWREREGGGQDTAKLLMDSGPGYPKIWLPGITNVKMKRIGD